MGNFGGFLKRFWRDGSGISASEYAMLTAVVAIGIILAIDQLSGTVAGTMDKVAYCLDGTILPSSCK
ncbi:MAG TPA: Flp family type IVb pilin [Kiloniellales bacterium]